MIVMLTVFSTTFEFHRAPRHVQFLLRQLVARWGSNLDTDAPDCDRTLALRWLRRYGVPGTPL